MVKMKKGDRGRQAWHDTVSQLARETGAAVPGNSPQKRRETRKRVAKQTKAASRWIDDAGLDARDLTAWARVDAMLDAPKTSHLIALDADDSDGGEYREDSHSDVDMDEDERKAARRAKKKDAPKKSRERKAPTKRKKKRNPEEERRRQRHRQRVLSQVLLDDFAPSRGAPAPRGADYVGAAARAPRPARAPHRVCVVTGKAAKYRDAATNQFFANADAGALLRENPPPWLRLGKHGSAYHEAMLQIRSEREDAGESAKATAAAPPRNLDGSPLAPGQKPGDPDPPGYFRGRKFD